MTNVRKVNVGQGQLRTINTEQNADWSDRHSWVENVAGTEYKFSSLLVPIMLRLY